MAERSGNSPTFWLVLLVVAVLAAAGVAAFIKHGRKAAEDSPRPSLNIELPKPPSLPEGPKLPPAPIPVPK